MTPTPQQQLIYSFIKDSSGSACITAVAGSGKTTTIVEACRLLSPSLDIRFMAFNKDIVVDLERKLPQWVKVSTFHSGCLAAVRKTFPSLKIDGGKVGTIVKAAIDPLKFKEEEYSDALKFLCQLISRGKSAGIGMDGFPANTPDVWLDLIRHFGMETDIDMGVAIPLLIKCYEQSLADTHTLDFDDMLLFACLPTVKFALLDVLFVDEGQDTNSVQAYLIRKMLRSNTGRLIIVGDPAQAIYGFRGAGSDSLTTISDTFQCTQLPLTVSWRCSTSIIKEARKFVSHIQPSPYAKEGTVATLDTFSAATFLAGDAVLCRNNRPLISLAFALLRAKRPVHFLGKDIAWQLTGIIKSLKATTMPTLCVALDDYRSQRLDKLLQQGRKAAYETLADKLSCIDEFVANSRAGTPDALCKEIAAFFSDKVKDPSSILLSTVHKSKGLEWSRVFILGYSELMPSPYAELPWQIQQEQNLCYVAITRAKDYLGYLSLEGYMEDSARPTNKSRFAKLIDSL